MSYWPDPEWISNTKAVKIEGGPNLRAFCEWVRLWNLRPDTVHKIARRHGKVEKNSLLAALEEDASRYREEVHRPHARIRPASAAQPANN